MARKDDIEFLTEYRDLVDKYLFTGYAPVTNEGLSMSERYHQVKEALKNPQFQQLRQIINRMTPRARYIASMCGINLIGMQPPPFHVGFYSYHNLFDLIINNTTLHEIPKQTFLDVIDQVIGALEANLDRIYFWNRIYSVVARWVVGILIVLTTLIFLYKLPQITAWEWLEVPWKHYAVLITGLVISGFISASIIDDYPSRRRAYIITAASFLVPLLIEILGLPRI